MTVLVVFSGLPGVGKTTLAQLTARDRGMTYLRIDEIEQALRSSGCLAGGVGPAGYMAAYALAASNLRLGRPVVADCVNPVAASRAAWRQVAAAAAAQLVEVEVICSDQAEHRARVEGRATDVAGLVPPAWHQVMAHDYERWDGPRLVLDTAGRTVAESCRELLDRVGAGIASLEETRRLAREGMESGPGIDASVVFHQLQQQFRTPGAQ